MTIVVGNLDHDSLQHIGIPCTDEMTEDAAILWAQQCRPVQAVLRSNRLNMTSGLWSIQKMPIRRLAALDCAACSR